MAPLISWIPLLGKVAAWLGLLISLLLTLAFIGQFTGVAAVWSAIAALVAWGALVRYGTLLQASLVALSLVAAATLAYFMQRPSIDRETRFEMDESYSLIGGAARQLELIYLFGTERDLLGLRILHRGNQVYCFPMKSSPQFIRELLVEICASANQLHTQPRFYATLRHNCTTTLLRHVNRIQERPIAWRREIFFPAQLGQLLHRIDYLDTDLNWPEAKKQFRADERITTATDLTQFSRALRML